jgi:hypothetical protein
LTVISNFPSQLAISALKLEPILFSETSAHTKATHREISGNGNLL